MMIAEPWVLSVVIRSAAYGATPPPTLSASQGGPDLLTEVVVPIATLIVGALLGVLFTVYLARPRLKVRGSGSGGGTGPGYCTSYAHITNLPGLMGVRLNQTVLFGRRVHGQLEKGLTIMSTPAEECMASVYDKKTGEFIAPLWWRSPSDPGRVVRTVSIKCGEYAELMIFARLNAELLRYFIYSSNGNESDVQPPVDEIKFNDTRTFSVRISYSYRRQKLEFDATMRKGYDGRLYYSVGPGGGGTF
jgi:hypothetical protein